MYVRYAAVSIINVFCCRVSLCGKIKLACFDKVCIYVHTYIVQLWLVCMH